MSLSKVTYVDGVTTIGAENLNAIQDEIIANASSISAKYLKPSGGIPKTDLDSSVQSSLDSVGLARYIIDDTTSNIYNIGTDNGIPYIELT